MITPRALSLRLLPHHLSKPSLRAEPIISPPSQRMIAGKSSLAATKKNPGQSTHPGFATGCCLSL
jgi:hypothetical protein